jgi:signal transduction histidine kinase
LKTEDLKNRNNSLERRVAGLQGLINDQFSSMIHFCLTIPFGGQALMEQMLRDLASLHTKTSLASQLYLGSYSPSARNFAPQQALEYVIAIHIKEGLMEKDWFRVEENGDGFVVHYRRENCFYVQHCSALVCEGFQCVCVRRFLYEGIIQGLAGEDYQSNLVHFDMEKEFCAFSFTKRIEPTDESQKLRDKISSTLEENLRMRDLVEARTSQLERQNASLETEILEHKRTEEKLRKATEEAQQANRMKLEFLANISHEFRTPLTSILGFPEIIRHSIGKFPEITQKDVDEILSFTRKISSQGNKLLSIINDLIDLSQIEGGGIEPEERLSSTHSLLSILKFEFETLAREKGISFIDRYAEREDILFMGDPKLLARILRNLLRNAIKFIVKGSIQLDGFPSKDRIIFQVRDEGIGMTEEEIMDIFNPFRQVDGSSTRKYGGLGVGLGLVKKLAEKMDGEVSVESQKGIGSTFTVSIPWKRPDQYRDSNREKT